MGVTVPYPIPLPLPLPKRNKAICFFLFGFYTYFLVSVDKRFICFSFLLFVRFSLLSFVFHGEVLGLGKLYSPSKKSCSAYHCAWASSNYYTSCMILTQFKKKKTKTTLSYTRLTTHVLRLAKLFQIEIYVLNLILNRVLLTISLCICCSASHAEERSHRRGETACGCPNTNLLELRIRLIPISSSPPRPKQPQWWCHKSNYACTDWNLEISRAAAGSVSGTGTGTSQRTY